MRDWLSFTAVIDKVGINPCVAIPPAISVSFKLRGYISVELDLNGTSHLANLVPLGGGQYRLYLNGPMLRASGWKVGDRVVIKLRHDPRPRIEPIPSSLIAAFKSHPKAQEMFSTLTPSRRKEISRYINNLKSDEAIESNTTRVIAALEGRGKHITVRP